jgi:DNA-binding LacI/PurR family transcriptional regulator
MNNPVKKLSIVDELVKAIRSEIGKAKPGDLLEPIDGIAKRYRVSTNSVRMALLLLANEGLVSLRQGRGSYVAEPPPAERVIALLSNYDIRQLGISWFYTGLVHSLRNFFHSRHYCVRLYIGEAVKSEDANSLLCPDFLRDMAENQIMGVAAVATMPCAPLMQAIQPGQIPIVFEGIRGPFIHGVEADRAGMIRDAVQALAQNGRTKIAFMGWGNPSESGRTTLSEELAARGLSCRADWIRHDLPPYQPGAGWAELREIWAAGPEKPDGLIVSDDVLFSDAVKAILELGIRVPEQLTVVTIDNKRSGLFYPFPVIRMELDVDEYARRMGEILLRVMRKEAVDPAQCLVKYRMRQAAANEAEPKNEPATGAFCEQKP